MLLKGPCHDEIRIEKPLELSLPVIVCANKMDRPEARPTESLMKYWSCYWSLMPMMNSLTVLVFASAKSGIASLSMEEEAKDMTPLFETIINYIPARRRP